MSPLSSFQLLMVTIANQEASENLSWS